MLLSDHKCYKNWTAVRSPQSASPFQPLRYPVSCRFVFVFALSQFSGPDYFGAWNRLAVRSPQWAVHVLEKRNEEIAGNDSGKFFRDIFILVNLCFQTVPQVLAPQRSTWCFLANEQWLLHHLKAGFLSVFPGLTPSSTVVLSVVVVKKWLAKTAKMLLVFNQNITSASLVGLPKQIAVIV